MSEADLEKLPYHLLVLAQKILNDETIDYSSVYQKYINLFKIEIFTGYKQIRNGSCSLLSPIYQELTNMNQLRGRTLCRLIPYDNSSFQLNQEEDLNLPLLGEYFIVGAR